MQLWEAANASPRLFGGKGMGAQRAAWTASFQAEAAARSGSAYAAALLDLVKCFERIPHALLAAAAAKRGNPLRLLRLALAVYRIRRSGGVGGRYSRCIVATRGITAGSGFATSELRVLLIDLVEVAARWWRSAEIWLYVDDLTIAVRGPRSRSAAQLAAIVDFIVRYFERVLKLEVSMAKSAVVAIDGDTVRAVARGLVQKTIKSVRATKLLGAAYAGGRKRYVGVLSKRLHDFRLRLKRLREFKRSGGNAAVYCRTAGLPAILYGADVTGVANTRLSEIRACIARAASPGAYGRCPELTLLTFDVAGQAIDPAFEANALPIVRWAAAAWERWVAVEDLQIAADAVWPSGAEPPSWRSVAGPAAATAATLHRLGWTWASAVQFVDDLGEAWNSLRESPAAIRDAVYRSVRRWRIARIALKWPAFVDGLADEGVLVPCLRGVAPLLKGTSREQPSVPLWSAACAPWLRSAMSNAQWTQSRRASVRSWNADQRCQLCLAAAGTPEHRYVCNATLPAAGWCGFSVEVSNCQAALTASRWRALRVHGLLLARVPVPIRTQAPLLRWLTAEPDRSRTDLNWYIDGSVVDQWIPELATSAAALVVVSHAGDLVAFAEAALPASARSSGAAETLGLYLACATSLRIPSVITDCKSLLDAARAGIGRATAASRPLAGTWTRIAAAIEVPIQRLVVDGLLLWMPSHVARSRISECKRSDGRTVTLLDWRANRLADAIAKRCAFAAAAPRADVARVEAASRAAATVAATLGVVTRAANRFPESRTTASGNVVQLLRRDAVAVASQPPGVPKRPWRARVPAPPRPLRPLAARPASAPAAARTARSPRSREAAAAARSLRARTAAASDFRMREALADRHGEAAPVAGDSYARRAALLERVRARQAAG